MRRSKVHALVCLAFALAASAIDPPLGAVGSAALSDPVVVGALERYDAATSAVIVRLPAGERLEFKLARQVRIYQGARRLAPQELAKHTGRRVKVRYVELGGRRLAHAITLASEPSSSPSPQAQAEAVPAEDARGAPRHRRPSRVASFGESYFLAGRNATIAWCSPFSLSRQVAVIFSPAFRSLMRLSALPSSE